MPGHRHAAEQAICLSKVYGRGYESLLREYRDSVPTYEEMLRELKDYLFGKDGS